MGAANIRPTRPMDQRQMMSRREFNAMQREVARVSRLNVQSTAGGYYETPGGRVVRALQKSEESTVAPHPFRTIIDPADLTKLKIGVDRAAPLSFDYFAIGHLFQQRATTDSFTPSTTGFVAYEIRRNSSFGLGEVTTFDVTLKVLPRAADIPDDAFFSGQPTSGEPNENAQNISLRYNVIIGHVTVSGGVITNWTQHRHDNFSVEERQTNLTVEAGKVETSVRDPRNSGLVTTSITLSGGPKFSLHMQHAPGGTWQINFNDETASPGGSPAPIGSQDAIILVGLIEFDAGGGTKVRRFYDFRHREYHFWTLNT